MIGFEISVVAAIMASGAFLALVMFGAALVRAIAWRKRERMSAARAPEILEALADYLDGSNDLARIRSLAESDRGAFTGTMMRFQGSAGGSAFLRLCELSLELGLVHEWMHDTRARNPLRRHTAYERLALVNGYGRCRLVTGDILLLALSDDDPVVRLLAARGAAKSDVDSEIMQLFGLALSQSLLWRIVLADALRGHASALSGNAIPEALDSRDPERVLAALEILVAWERMVPNADLPRLLAHPDQRIRLAVLKLAPLAPLVAENRAAIVKALEDPEPEAAMAAALAAGRLNLTEAIPALTRLLRLGPADVRRHAASALAGMPPRGWRALEELSVDSSPVTAALAGEALARVRGKAGA